MSVPDVEVATTVVAGDAGLGSRARAIHDDLRGTMRERCGLITERVRATDRLAWSDSGEDATVSDLGFCDSPELLERRQVRRICVIVADARKQ